MIAAIKHSFLLHYQLSLPAFIALKSFVNEPGCIIRKKPDIFEYSRILIDIHIPEAYFAPMELENAAKQLEALGNSTRLEIYRFLAHGDPDGCPVGEIRDELDIPASTLSHHIAKLVNTGLVTQVRESRSLVCRVDSENMDTLMEFLVQNCCTEDWYIQSG